MYVKSFPNLISPSSRWKGNVADIAHIDEEVFKERPHVVTEERFNSNNE
jgi:hypothetical protein